MFNGCISYKTHMKGIESHAHQIKSKYEAIKETETSVSGFKLFWFFPVTANPDIQKAIDTAIIKENGDNIIDLRLWSEKQYWIVGTIDIITLQGKVIRYVD